MPPKLRKDKLSSGANTPSANANAFAALSDHHQTTAPSNATSTNDVVPTKPSPQKTSDPTIVTMQQDIASMAQLIKTLSTSIHKMDKLDKIDTIDSRQKSSENRLTEMVSELRSQIE